jgi:hypothetical protein
MVESGFIVSSLGKKISVSSRGKKLKLLCFIYFHMILLLQFFYIY